MRRENYQSLDDSKSGTASSLHEKAEEYGQQNCERKHGKSKHMHTYNYFSFSFIYPL